jgi:hypothetical protein
MWDAGNSYAKPAEGEATGAVKTAVVFVAKFKGE